MIHNNAFILKIFNTYVSGITAISPGSKLIVVVCNSYMHMWESWRVSSV